MPRLLLDGEFDDLHLVADLWIGGWALVGLAAVTWLWVLRARRGVTTAGRAALVPAVHCAAAAALVALAWGLSFPLDTWPRYRPRLRMVPPAGFEPAAHGLGNRCSIP